MPIKAGLTADCHFNVARRSDEAKRILEWMLKDWVERQVDIIGIAGDLMDGPMTEKERLWLWNFVQRCANFAPVAIVYGNHCARYSLDFLAELKAAYPIVVEPAAGVHVVDTKNGKIAVACVAFPWKAEILAKIGPASGDDVDAITGRALQDVFRGLGARVRELGLPTVGLIHGTVRGSKISVDDQPDRPLGMDMDPLDIKLMDCDFVCAGHIHLAQSFAGGSIATPSSAFYTDWGEARHEKGYILATFETTRDSLPTMVGDNLTERDGDPYTVCRWERIPTPAVPMILIEGAWSEEHELAITSKTFPTPEVVNGADVRLRYETPSDKRKTAGERAGKLRDQMLANGAINVRVEEIVTPTTKSRIPGLSKATTLNEKLLMYWESINFTPDTARRLALAECLAEIQEEAAAAGLGMGTAGRAAPALKRVRGKGWLKFPGEFDIDISSLGELATIVAPNETGKTLLMQLMSAGVMYVQTPTRGSLNDLSVAKDSFIEATFDMGGAEYVLAQNVNGMARTGSVSLLKNGQPELSKAGRAEYKEWADKFLLPSSVYDAVICQSGTESVIDLKEGPRVELLLRVLGLEAYEVLAEKARKRTTAIDGELSQLRAKIEALQSSSTVEVYDEDIAKLTADLRTATEELRLGEVTLADLRTKNDAATLVQRDAIQTGIRIKELETREQNLMVRISALNAEIDAQRRLMDEKAEIDSAVLRSGLLANELESLRKLAGQLGIDLSTVTGKHQGLRDQQVAKQERYSEVSAVIQRLETKRTVLSAQIQQNFTTILDAKAITDAVAETARLNSSLQTKRVEAASLIVTATELAGSLNETRARFNGNAQRASEMVRKRTALEAAVKGKESATNAAEQVIEVERDLATVETEWSRWREEIEHLQSKIGSSKDSQISELYGGHNDIAGGLAEPVARALKAMEESDTVAAEAELSPGLLVTAKAEANKCDAAATGFRNQLVTLRATAMHLPAILAAEAELAALITEAEASDSLHWSLMEESNGIIRQQEEIASQQQTVNSDIKGLVEQIEGYVPLVDRAPRLATAEDRIKALEEQRTGVEAELLEANETLTRVRDESYQLVGAIDVQLKQVDLADEAVKANARTTEELEFQIRQLSPLTGKAPALAQAKTLIDRLEHQLGGLTDEYNTVYANRCDLSDKLPVVAPIILDLAEYIEAVDKARGTAISYGRELALAESNKQAVVEMTAKRDGFAAQLKPLEALQANWTLLGLHLGKDALQKEEIASASGQLTDITNDLLRLSGDSRHTVSVSTEKLAADKKRMIPCLDLNVFDSEEGQTKESKRLSDAGKIIVGWPFSLALIVLGCERAGIKGPTIFVDEAAGPLDPVNAPRCASTLRHFAQRLGSQVIYIAQQPEIQALADTTITIDDGIVTVS